MKIKVKAIVAEDGALEARCPLCQRLVLVRQDVDGHWSRRVTFCPHLTDVETVGREDWAMIFCGRAWEPEISHSPWFARKEIVTDSMGNVLLRALGLSSRDQANVRLASAAPEMFAVLKALVVESMSYGGVDEETINTAINVLRKAGDNCG